MKTIFAQNRRNLALYVASAALMLSLLALMRSNTATAYAAPANPDPWKSERQYPPLVFNSKAWLDCSISSTANGPQTMSSMSGQGFTFFAPMLPIQKSKLQRVAHTARIPQFDSLPS